MAKVHQLGKVGVAVSNPVLPLTRRACCAATPQGAPVTTSLACLLPPRLTTGAAAFFKENAPSINYSHY